MPAPVSATESSDARPLGRAERDGPTQCAGPSVDGARLDRERAAVGHRVARVDGEVHHHLLELARVGADRARGPGSRRVTSSTRSPTRRRSSGSSPDDDLVEVEHARLEHLPAREREQLPGERGGLLARARDLLDLRPERVVRGEPAEDEVAVAVHDGEDVVEVVGDAAGEAADRVHLLRLPELRLEARALLLGAAALGDVADVAGEERPAEELAARDRELDRELARRRRASR